MRRLLVATCLLAAAAFAQELSEVPREAAPEEPAAEQAWRFRAGGGATFVAGGDVNGASDAVDLWIDAVHLGAGGPAWRGSHLDFDLSWEHRRYDLGDDNRFFPGFRRPFRDVHSVAFGATLLQAFSPEWGALLRGGVRGAAEVGADLEDGISAVFLAGAGHQVTERLRLGAGVVVSTRFEDDLSVFPGLYVDWRFADDWVFRVAGAGAEIAWTPAPAWTLTLAARFETRRFRLADDLVTRSGIVEDERIPVGLTARWRPDPALDLEITIGADVYRRFEVTDEDGRSFRAFGADPGFFVGGGLTLRF